VIEKWLNNTLNEAQYFDIPGIVLKPEN